MNKSKTIVSLEEALRNFWLAESKDADLPLSEKQVKLILSSQADSFKMSEDKRAQLIDKLYHTSSYSSLGELIEVQQKAHKIKDKQLEEVSQLPKSVIKDLKQDKVYPNNIPVFSLSKLLSFLNVSVQLSHEAIVKTFEILQKNVMLRLGEEQTKVAYRRNSGTSGFKSSKVGKHDGRVV